MQRLVNTIALAAALVAVIAGLWGNHTLLMVLKRAVISYLVFYFVGSILMLAYRIGVHAEQETKIAAVADKPATTASKNG
ncbi:MAG: hypothetical protein ABIF77_14735 [bacterium]